MTLDPVHFYQFFLNFEKMIEIRMRNFLNKNDILTASQYGFKTNSSTELAITTLYDKLLDNLNNKKLHALFFLMEKKHSTRLVLISYSKSWSIMAFVAVYGNC